MIKMDTKERLREREVKALEQIAINLKLIAEKMEHCRRL